MIIYHSSFRETAVISAGEVKRLLSALAEIDPMGEPKRVRFLSDALSGLVIKEHREVITARSGDGDVRALSLSVLNGPTVTVYSIDGSVRLEGINFDFSDQTEFTITDTRLVIGGMTAVDDTCLRLIHPPRQHNINGKMVDRIA